MMCDLSIETSFGINFIGCLFQYLILPVVAIVILYTIFFIIRDLIEGNKRKKELNNLKVVNSEDKDE